MIRGGCARVGTWQRSFSICPVAGAAAPTRMGAQKGTRVRTCTHVHAHTQMHARTCTHRQARRGGCCGYLGVKAAFPWQGGCRFESELGRPSG